MVRPSELPNGDTVEEPVVPVTDMVPVVPLAQNALREGGESVQVPMRMEDSEVTPEGDTESDFFRTERFRKLRPRSRIGYFEPVIEKAGLKHGVDPEMLRALAIAESDGDPYAGSPKSAKGLFQITPITERQISDIASRMGLDFGESGFDPYNPEHAAEGAALYWNWLSNMAKRVSGGLGDRDLTDAVLLGYNYGPTHMTNFLRKGGAEAIASRAPRETLTHRNRFWSNVRDKDERVSVSGSENAFKQDKNKEGSMERALQLMLGDRKKEAYGGFANHVQGKLDQAKNRAAAKEVDTGSPTGFLDYAAGSPSTAVPMGILSAIALYGLGRRGAKSVGKGVGNYMRRYFKNPMKFESYKNYMDSLRSGAFKNPKQQMEALKGVQAELLQSPQYARPELMDAITREMTNLKSLTQASGRGDILGNLGKYITEKPGQSLGWLAAAGMAAKAPEIASGIVGGNQRRGRGGPVVVQG